MGYLRNVKNTMRLITLLGMKMSKEGEDMSEKHVGIVRTVECDDE